MKYDWILPPESLPGRPITRHLRRHRRRVYFTPLAHALFGGLVFLLALFGAGVWGLVGR